MASFEMIVPKYRSLRLSSIAEALPDLVARANDNEPSYLDFAEIIVDKELGMRAAKRTALNMKRAGFPIIKRLEEFDYRFQTTITKKQVTRLLDFTFIDNRENLVFIGPPGVGKTHLATGISVKAIDAGYRVSFSSVQTLMEQLDLAEKKGELKKKIGALLKNDLIVIDELGYLPMNRSSMYNLFQLINAVYEYRSLIVTTNKDFTNWGEFFFDDNVAVPVVDRIIHHSHIFMMGGESYRLKEKLKG